LEVGTCTALTTKLPIRDALSVLRLNARYLSLGCTATQESGIKQPKVSYIYRSRCDTRKHHISFESPDTPHYTRFQLLTELCSMTHSRDVVAGIEMAFFIPTALLSAIICFRHGVHRSSGWVYTLILCIVRIAGAVCQFLSHNNHTSNLIQTTVIIDSIGLSPLLLATLGMLSRLYVP
jgi:hypothetical protein